VIVITTGRPDSPFFADRLHTLPVLDDFFNFSGVARLITYLGIFLATIRNDSNLIRTVLRDYYRSASAHYFALPGTVVGPLVTQRHIAADWLWVYRVMIRRVTSDLVTTTVMTTTMMTATIITATVVWVTVTTSPVAPVIGVAPTIGIVVVVITRIVIPVVVISVKQTVAQAVMMPCRVTRIIGVTREIGIVDTEWIVIAAGIKVVQRPVRIIAGISVVIVVAAVIIVMRGPIYTAVLISRLCIITLSVVGLVVIRMIITGAACQADQQNTNK